MRPFQTKMICQLIDNGGVIGYPTESSFGIGCDPANAAAVQHILQIKQRPVHKGLILVCADFSQLHDWVKPLSPAIAKRVKKTWPGPHNWVLPAQANAPDWVTGGRSSVAVRVSKHPVIIQLCETLGYPLVSTSANIGGQKPLHHSLHVSKQFGRSLDYIVSGRSGGLSACPITDATSLQAIRI